jgi:hypothetical protein
MPTAFLVFIVVFAFIMSNACGAEFQGGPEDYVPDVRQVQQPEGMRKSRPPPPVQKNAVYVENFGDTFLRFQYWNPADEKWVTVELLPGKNLTIACPQCDKHVTVSFHDGTNARTAALNLGAPYALYWTTDRWDVGPWHGRPR